MYSGKFQLTSSNVCGGVNSGFKKTCVGKSCDLQISFRPHTLLPEQRPLHQMKYVLKLTCSNNKNPAYLTLSNARVIPSLNCFSPPLSLLSPSSQRHLLSRRLAPALLGRLRPSPVRSTVQRPTPRPKLTRSWRTT